MQPRSLKSLELSLFAPLLAALACSVPHPVESQALRSQVGQYELEVVENGKTARTYLHEGETHVLGQQGGRYVLRVHNRSSQRIEAVVSVDGLDVIDGQPADYAHKRGYLVEAHGYVDIDGWRLNDREAAAFRFAAVADSYAAKTGRARNVGVIGVAVFPERPRPVARKPLVQPEQRYEAALRDERLHEAERSSDMTAPPPAAAPAAPQKSGTASAEADASSGAAVGATATRRARSGLGTEFGEAVASEIRQVPFRRANATTPSYVLGARYNDRDGLLALGIPVDGCDDDLALRQTAHPFPVSAPHYARPPSGWVHD
jgi:hypothetical protein